MPPTMSDLLDEKSKDLIAYIESPINLLELDLPGQAALLLKSDAPKLKRLGHPFIVPKDDELKPHLKEVNFNPFLAELLLREGSLLLDRCLQQRREYEELQTKWFEACIQIDELIRLNNITKEEEAQNYGIPELIAKCEQDALSEETSYHNKLTKIFDEMYERAGKIEDEFGKGNLHNSSSIQSYQELRLQDSIKARIKGAEKNVVLRKSLANFQRMRNEVARLVALRRVEQIRIPGGALNFLEQLEPIKKRFDNDLAAAWLRLSAAAKGFNDLYKHPIEDFPKLSPHRELDFDDLVTWCQYTNTWLASFLDTQQQVTRSFSLKELVKGENNFKKGLELSQWSFPLTAEDFYNRQYVRMRGLSVQIDSGHQSGSGSWNVIVKPPSTLQNQIGTLFLGRVNERTYAVVSESSAPPKLYNASPNGAWVIEVFKGSTSGIPASKILDIDIHLTVALV